MATVTFRADYAKFLIEAEPEVWNHMYRVFCETSHELKVKGEFLKSHKTNRLWYNAEKGMETWTLEVWGEWTAIVHRLPANWSLSLKRYDVRAVVWDATEDTILDLGQHLQRHLTSHNVHVYATKPASKRLGRDRGGKGFAIGSHKSDLRVTCYKRTGEPVAQEFQVTGAMLTRIKNAAWNWYQQTGQTIDIWTNIGKRCEAEGNKRLIGCLERAGVGTYWPTVGAHNIPELPPTQGAFLAELSDIIEDHSQELDEGQR